MLNVVSNISEAYDGAEVACRWSPLTRTVEDLLPEESAVVARAVEKRQREFATGRYLARSIMADFGIRDFPLLNDSDRVPVWPAGFIGSISHCDDLCVVAVARQRHRLKGIGVDVEPDAPLEAELWPLIATAGELDWVRSQDEMAPGRLVRLIYSAKEAVYKSLFPTCRLPLAFCEVEVDLSLQDRRFTYRLAPEDRNAREKLPLTGGGGWEHPGHHVLTTVLWHG